MDIDALVTHFRDRLVATGVQPAPMAHAIVDDVLPQDAYDLAIRSIPPLEYFQDEGRSKMDWWCQDNAPSEAASVWRALDEAWFPAIVPVIAHTFGDALHAHAAALFGPERAGAAISSLARRKGRVMLRRRGYHLAPHRDPLPGFITVLMYLAREGDSPAFGTQLYRVDGDAEVDHSKTFYPPADRCERVVDVAFRPNRALIFMNTPGGAHGADIPRNAPADLERYSFQAYIGVGTGALREIVSGLPVEQQQRWAEKYRTPVSMA